MTGEVPSPAEERARVHAEQGTSTSGDRATGGARRPRADRHGQCATGRSKKPPRRAARPHRRPAATHNTMGLVAGVYSLLSAPMRWPASAPRPRIRRAPGHTPHRTGSPETPRGNLLRRVFPGCRRPACRPSLDRDSNRLRSPCAMSPVPALHLLGVSLPAWRLPPGSRLGSEAPSFWRRGFFAHPPPSNRLAFRDIGNTPTPCDCRCIASFCPSYWLRESESGSRKTGSWWATGTFGRSRAAGRDFEFDHSPGRKEGNPLLGPVPPEQGGQGGGTEAPW